MSSEEPLNAGEQALIDAAWDRHKNTKPLTPAQIAYARLWRSMSDCLLVKEARITLRDSLTHEERRAAIAWLIAAYGEMSDASMIAADMRAGVFPQRSYDPSI